jgi:hypothetical protein
MRHLVLGFMGSLLLFAVACGGKVVVEAAGAGGSGTGGSGNGGDVTASTGDVSPVGVVSSASSSTGGASLCEQACSVLAAKGCGDTASCVSGCQQTYATAGACTPQLDAAVTCILNSKDPSCNNPPECAASFNSYQACMNQGTCGNAICGGGSDGSCSCTADCGGSKLEVQCTPGNATDVCLCLKDGMPVGKCSQPQTGSLSCDILKGCCGGVFFP